MKVLVTLRKTCESKKQYNRISQQKIEEYLFKRKESIRYRARRVGKTFLV